MNGRALMLVALALLLAGCGRSTEISSLPDLQWNSYQDYRAAPYVRAATKLQALGREAACRILEEETRARYQGNQVIVLCRMLFKKRAGSEFRRPMLGAAEFFGGTDYDAWPLEPIELVDGVPFLITRGYKLAGEPEPAGSYLQYCIANCDWNADPIREPKPAELKSALARVVTSGKWKRPLDSSEKEFLSTQIE